MKENRDRKNEVSHIPPEGDEDEIQIVDMEAESMDDLHRLSEANKELDEVAQSESE